MKVLILAGGMGYRLSEETTLKPKPMVEIGGKPILWHIMKIYSSYGFKEFIILCGYKGYMIKSYFVNYYRHMADITVDLAFNKIEYHKNNSEPWKVTLVDTGLETLTGSRIKKVKEYVGDEPFMLTYGDGLSDINIKELLEFHNNHNHLVTLTSIQPEGRFGSLELDETDRIMAFREKPKGDGAWINGGFFVCQPEVFDFIPDGEKVSFESDTLVRLADAGELVAYKYEGFWKPMDTQRDKFQLEELIEMNKAPWIQW